MTSEYEVIEELDDTIHVRVKTTLEFVYDGQCLEIETLLTVEKYTGRVVIHTQHTLSGGYLGTRFSTSISELESVIEGLREHLEKVKRVAEELKSV